MPSAVLRRVCFSMVLFFLFCVVASTDSRRMLPSLGPKAQRGVKALAGWTTEHDLNWIQGGDAYEYSCTLGLKVGEKLGGGNFGSVYELDSADRPMWFWDLKENTEYVLKRVALDDVGAIRKEVQYHQFACGRAKNKLRNSQGQEVSVAPDLAYAWICDGFAYLMMERVVGSLEKYSDLQRNKDFQMQVLAIFDTLLHNGVEHMDEADRNIGVFVTKDKKVLPLALDFGLAKPYTGGFSQYKMLQKWRGILSQHKDTLFSAKHSLPKTLNEAEFWLNLDKSYLLYPEPEYEEPKYKDEDELDDPLEYDELYNLAERFRPRDVVVQPKQKAVVTSSLFPVTKSTPSLLTKDGLMEVRKPVVHLEPLEHTSSFVPSTKLVDQPKVLGKHHLVPRLLPRLEDAPSVTTVEPVMKKHRQLAPLERTSCSRVASGKGKGAVGFCYTAEERCPTGKITVPHKHQVGCVETEVCCV
eukprot:gnl/Spiro4/10884_TR5798_c0_g1_i1.p1 gnl/Spiro4/10884_TR5798_c0_g1~~gnl/Spiro4/10884_TR5798_c0_g1_i1.p1  ORF type:complete len:469 (-),score=76.71 gnl/Spiro4/10884_TR5798_c0_g1_i1:83-1489(-)